MNGEASANATQKIARFAANLRYEDLSPELVTLLKRCVLDTLGVTIGASGLADEGRIALDYVQDMGGKPESTILGFGGKAPAAWATFVNGGLGHMLDYDDVASGHPSIATLLPALAVAEKIGGISGRDLLTAMACGSDIFCRIDDAIPIPDWTDAEGWFATQLFGFISGAASAGKVLGLDEERMHEAMGIGFNQLSGSRQMAAGASSHMRSMQAGISGQGGVMAAQLAQRGMTGSRDFLEGRFGLFRTYIRAREPDWNALLGGLGERFALLRKHGFKVWPACHHTRGPNTAILQLRQQHGLQASDVETLTIIGGHASTQQLSEPLARKRRPQVAIDGKFSVPFTCAVMMTRGNVLLRDYTDEGLRDPEVLAMADRVSWRAPPQDAPKGSFAEVEIVTRDGRVLRQRADALLGDWNCPVDQAHLDAKFRDCVSFSARPIPKANIDRAMESIADLENVADATDIVRLLTP